MYIERVPNRNSPPAVRVERAFRSLKTVGLKVRPVHHRLADRVQAHVLLCTLAYYVEWLMRRQLAPILFDDEHKTPNTASPVQPPRRFAAARIKANSRRTHDGLRHEELPVRLRDRLHGRAGTCRRSERRLGLGGTIGP